MRPPVSLRIFLALLVVTFVAGAVGLLTDVREWVYLAVVVSWVNAVSALVALAASLVARLDEC